MGYTAIQVPFRKARFSIPKEGASQTVFTNLTEDLRDLPQFLTPQQAINIKNYFVTIDGGLEKRKGLKRLFALANTIPTTMVEKFTDTIYLYAYSNILAAYDVTTASSTIIKNDFTNSDSFSGQTYGDYFFVCNGGDPIARVYRQVTYTGQTVVFQLGEIVTGVTSGATAIILENNNNGSTGTLVLGNIIGTFISGEIINSNEVGSGATATAHLSTGTVGSISVDTGGSGYAFPPSVQITGGGGSGATAGTTIVDGVVTTVVMSNNGSGYGTVPIVTITSIGSATLSSAVTWGITFIAGAPNAHVLRVIGPRLYAGNLQNDPTAVAYSDEDIGTNPPFTHWVVGTNAIDPGLLRYANAGTITAINGLGNNIVVGATNGKWAFTTTTISNNNILTKVDQVVFQRIDMGMGRGNIVTPAGMFYANHGGLWKIASLGQSNVPFSEQESDPGVLLGTQYFNNIDLTESDMAYLPQYNTILLTCARNSLENNFVIAYNIVNDTFSEFTGWKINRFMTNRGVLFGASSTSTTIWTCFEGYSDDGVDIWTNFLQEVKTGQLETRQILLGQYIQGLLSPGTILNINFDIYNVKGNYVPKKLQFKWVASSANTSKLGWGETSWGGSSFGANSDPQNLVEDFAGARGYIRNFQRLRVQVTGHDKLPHQLNWLKLDFREKINIRRRTLQQITN